MRITLVGDFLTGSQDRPFNSPELAKQIRKPLLRLWLQEVAARSRDLHECGRKEESLPSSNSGGHSHLNPEFDKYMHILIHTRYIYGQSKSDLEIEGVW